MKSHKEIKQNIPQLGKARLKYQSVINNIKDTTGTLIKPTPKSEELSIINILSALVLVVFFENVCSNKPLEITIIKAVNG